MGNTISNEFTKSIPGRGLRMHSDRSGALVFRPVPFGIAGLPEGDTR